MKKTFLYASCALAINLLAASAQAQNPFPYTGGNINSNVVYDGLGTNLSQNPLTIGSVGNLGDDYFANGAGETATLTVLSGTLTINDDDMKFGAGGGTANVFLGANAILNINNIGQWSGAFDNYGGSVGICTISNGAVLNWYLAGSSQQRIGIGSGPDPSNVGILNLEGGTFNVTVTTNITDTAAGFNIGWNDGAGGASPISGGVGTLNLNAGTLNDEMALPFTLGGGFTGMPATPVFSGSSTTNVMNISNGVFVMTQIFTNDPSYPTKAPFHVGPFSYVNFLEGGTGALELTNWTASDFQSLASQGVLATEGAPATFGDFVVTTNNGMGILKLGPFVVTGPVISTPEYGFSTNSVLAGEAMSLIIPSVYDVNANPTYTYQWYSNSTQSPTWTLILGATSSNLVLNTTTLYNGFASPYGYYVVVSDNYGNTITTASVAVNVNLPAEPPTLVQDIAPLNIPLTVGEAATLSATFTGDLPISYQWQYGTSPTGPFTNIPNMTSNVFTIASAALTNTGYYQLFASNSIGVSNSSVANVTVSTFAPSYPPPGSVGAYLLSNNPAAFWQLNETNDPSSGFVQAFDFSGNHHNGTYGAAAQDWFNLIRSPQPATYPGFTNGQGALEVSGVANSMVTIPNLNLSTNTAAATIAMWINPSAQPGTFTGLFFNRNGGDAAGLGFGGSQSGNSTALGYTWNNSGGSYNWNSGLYPPLNTWSFVVLVVQSNQATIYMDYVTNGQPVLYSAVNNNAQTFETFNGGTTLIGGDVGNVNRTFTGLIADVAVYNAALSYTQILQLFGVGVGVQNFAPDITGQPQPLYVALGSSAQFSATGINGTPPLGYQWQFNGTNVTNAGNFSGANTTTLSITNVTTNDAGLYALVVTNAYGTNVSSNAALVVQLPSLIGQWLNGQTNFSDVSGYTPAGTHDGFLIGSGSVTFTNDVPPARSGMSAYFNNTGLAISNSASGDPGYVNTFDTPIQNAFTVSFWAKGIPSGGWTPWASKFGEGEAGWQFRSGSQNNIPCWTVRDNSAGSYFTVGSGPQWSNNGDLDDMHASSAAGTGNYDYIDGNWHFYAGTYNALTGIRNLYVDGKLEGQETGNTPYILAAAEHVCIMGKDSPSATPPSFGNYNTGEIYDVRVYNYALTQAQIGPVGPEPAPLTQAVIPPGSGGNNGNTPELVFTFPWGRLLAATNVTGPWTVIATNSPYTNSESAPQMFFRGITP